MNRPEMVRKLSLIQHNSSAKLVLLWLAEFGPMPRAQIEQDLNIGEATLKRALKLLRETELISENPRLVRLNEQESKQAQREH